MQIKNVHEITDTVTYYQEMKSLARRKRREFDVISKEIDLNKIRRIYKAEKIKIDYHVVKSPRIKAAYFCDEVDSSVLVKKSLPREPKLFALIHELKHHFFDRKYIERGDFACGDYNQNKTIEIGAEVFSAEFIFPEAEMRNALADFGIDRSNCTPEKIVHFKRACGIPISYTYIRKRLNFFGIIDEFDYRAVKFKKLEDQLYPPVYRHRKSRK